MKFTAEDAEALALPKTRKKPAQLTPRSLKLLREEGYLCAVTEHWNAHVRIRQDLWQFCDMLAIRRGEVLAVQVTSAANRASRRTKIAENENVPRVREAGIRIELHTWDKSPKGFWRVNREDLS